MTSSSIRSAWAAAIFDSVTIKAYTPKYFQYDVTAISESAAEDQLLFYNQKINFFKQTIARIADNSEIRGSNSGVRRYIYDVEVSYYLERDFAATDTNYNNVVDRIETLDSLVRTGLGSNWSSTVDYWEVSGLLKPQIINLAERSVWWGGYSYRAIASV